MCSNYIFILFCKLNKLLLINKYEIKIYIQKINSCIINRVLINTNRVESLQNNKKNINPLPYPSFPLKGLN